MPTSPLLESTAIGRTLVRMASEIVEKGERAQLLRGKLDITLYRDDLQDVPAPRVGITELQHDLTGKVVVIVDDVLHTGRTIRAALDELAEFGRPRRILLAV